MAVYRYNVVVEVDIDTKKANQGNQEQKRMMRSLEQETIDSQRRMDNELEKSIRQHQQASHRAYNDRVADLRRQEQRFLESQRVVQESQDRELKNMLTRQRERLRYQEQDQQASIDSTKKYWRERLRQAAQAHSLENQIIAKDPFQNLGTRGQTASQSGQSIRNLIGTERFNAQIRALDPFQSQKNISLGNVNSELDAFDNKLKASRSSLGMWGQAFKGAFIGAIAGITFSVLIGSITELTTGIVKLGISSVQTAGDLEVTTNALAVFTGSTKLAKKELQDIDNVARNTPGLRLEAAEQGFQKLRALGFGAQQASAFIKELGEEKILSGASDESLERIIFNFSQIASGGQKVSQELREILTQMPSMRNAFYEAFGTLDPKKIQTFFDRNTDEAFKRLTDAMASQKAATGGLNDAWGKLSDEMIIAGRQFGEPFLDPVTNDLRALSSTVNENASVWTQWGLTVSDAYRGVSANVREFNSLINSPFVQGVGDTIPQGTASTLLFGGFGTYFNYANSKGEALRKLQESAKQTGVFSDSEEQNTAQTAIVNTEQKLQEQLQKSVQKRLGIIQEYYNERISIIQDNQRIEQAIIDSTLTYTTQQEIDVLTRKQNSLEKSLQNQIEATRQYYAELINLNQGNETEVLKATFERNQKLRGLSSDLAESQLRFQKELAEKEREILETRRQAQIETLSLNQREISQIYDKRIFDTERAIDREETTVSAGYDRLAQLTQDKYEYISAFTKQQYELRLQDLKLTEEQRANLIREANLTEAQLAEENRRALQQIEEQKTQKQLQEIDKRHDGIRTRLENLSNLYSTLGASFNFSKVDKDFVDNLGKTFFGGDIDVMLKNAEDKQKQIIDAANAANEQLYGKDTILDFSREGLEVYNEQLKKADKELENLNKNYSDQSKMIFRVTKAYQQGTASLEEFQDIQLRIFDNETLIGVQKYINEYARLQDKIEATTNQKDKDAFKREQEAVVSEKDIYQFNRANERSALYRETLKGINEEIAKLQSGDKDVLRVIGDSVKVENANRIRDTLKEIAKLEIELANGNANAANEQRLAILEKQVEIRNREADALTRIAVAQQEILQKGRFSQNQADADLAEFFANQKGLTETLSDARINLITDAYSGLDKVAESLAKNFGFAKDAAQELIASLLKLAANYIFQKFMLGGNSSGNTRSFGIGGTPNYNPNSNFGNNLIQQITGGGGSSIGGGSVQAVNGDFYFPNGTPRYSAYTNILPSAASVQAQGFGNINPNSGALNGINKLIGSIAPVAGFGLGGALGGGSGIGGILGGAGGLIGGTLLSTLISGGFTGATATGGIFGSIGGAIGLSGAATAGIGAAIAGVALLASFFIGRNARRRREEKQREKAIGDAFRQLDDLIAKVNGDQIDGSQALEQADQIRQSYLDAMGQLKDSKTRSHALKDVSRLDSKIEQLKAAVAGQTSRRQRLELFAPTFADGGSLSRFARNNFRDNPLGYQRGPGSARSDSMLGYFPASNTYARFSDTEYIFDAETVRNIGVSRLDQIRQTKGQALNQMLFRWNDLPQRRDGGGITAPVVQNASPVAVSGATQVHIHVDGSAFGELIANALAVVVQNNNGSTQQLKAIGDTLENNGQNKMVEQIAQLVLAKLGNVR